MPNVIPFPALSQESIGEVEMALLGILITHPSKLDDVRGILKAEGFLFIAHRHIYEVLRDAAFRGHVLDARSIAVVLRDDLFVESGMSKAQYISYMLGFVVSPMQAKHYAKTIMDDCLKRRIKWLAASDLNEADKAREMSVLAQEIDAGSASEAVSLSDALDRANGVTEVLYRNGGGFAGLPTGLIDLDDKLCGLERGGLYVVAGRPAMGKSALGLSVAMNVASTGKPVQFFSLEMSVEQIAHRVNARFAGVGIGNQKTGRNVDFTSLMNARQELNGVPLTIVEKSGVTAEWICTKAKELGRGSPPRLILIDHLGIVAARDARTPRVLQVGEMTAMFKSLAKEMDCPVMLLHQLNRGVEGRDDKRPGLADLRDSGSVEQDADAVIMIYREEYYLKNAAAPTDAKDWARWQERRDAAKNRAELIIAKNRQGETGILCARFDGARQTFENLV